MYPPSTLERLLSNNDVHEEENDQEMEATGYIHPTIGWKKTTRQKTTSIHKRLLTVLKGNSYWIWDSRENRSYPVIIPT